MNNQSSKWKLNVEDIGKWLNNALIFLAPVAVIYLGSVAQNLQDGVNLSDFAISPAIQGMIALYAVNTFLDLFRKLAKGPQPQ